MTDYGPNEVVIDVSFTQALIERIQMECDDTERVEEWVAAATRMRLAAIDRELATSHDVTCEVEVPMDIVRRAHLRAKHARESGKKDVHMEEYLLDYVSIEYDWWVDENHRHRVYDVLDERESG